MKKDIAKLIGWRFYNKQIEKVKRIAAKNKLNDVDVVRHMIDSYEE